ncbi:hypothetical protein FHR32_006056 [Streptosporangium album]|uniref:Uncharacterized protein n=1 Tax=Streptosporangium album TaxID=47479 RepID=A0A7W7S0J2_9ACTN|nr:hypothetical protein [Streptosporangium album]
MAVQKWLRLKVRPPLAIATAREALPTEPGLPAIPFDLQCRLPAHLRHNAPTDRRWATSQPERHLVRHARIADGTKQADDFGWLIPPVWRITTFWRGNSKVRPATRAAGRKQEPLKHLQLEAPLVLGLRFPILPARYEQPVRPSHPHSPEI